MSLFDPKFSLNVPKKKFVRVNTLKISVPEALKVLEKKNIKVRKTNLSYCFEIVDSDFNIVSTKEYLEGFFYLQDYGSQLACAVMEPKKEDLILDMASAPGSKLSQIAQLTENESRIVSLEINFERVKKIESNLSRLGVDNVVSLNINARDFLNDAFDEDFEFKFDKILLDTPCSGNFCVEDNWFEKRSEKDIREMSFLQYRLLLRALDMLKPGGELVYSTCTLNVDENEKIVNKILENWNVELIDLSKFHRNTFNYEEALKKLGLRSEISKCIRIMNSTDDLEPFFICKMKKN